MSKSYDLSTSSKWANLADGSHTVKLKSKGSGYGSSSFSNSVTVTKGGAMPVKGDLITIETKQYRVLKTNGSVAEVLAMYDASTSVKFDTNSSYNNTYAGKNIDTYCNSTFYSSLSTAMKTAIVDKTFTQDSWSLIFDTSGGTGTAIYQGTTYSSSYYRVGLVNAAYGTSISRKCYVLSVQDVIDYLEVTTAMDVTSTTLTSVNIWKMFWNRTTSPNSPSPWLRSAKSDNANTSFYITRDIGRLSAISAGSPYAVRPAFQIDLSKIEWSPVGGGN